MKKITLVPMLVLAIVVGFALSTAAAQEPNKQPGAEEPQLIMAVIKQVDTTAQTVTIETKEQQKGTFKVDSQTTITVDGKKATLADLKVGQRAKIAFNNQGKAISIDA